VSTVNFVSICLICLLGLYWGAKQLYGRWALRVRGVKTEATCLNVGREEKGGYRYKLEYAVGEEALVQFTSGGHEFPMRIGEKINVIYDPKAPGNRIGLEERMGGRNVLGPALVGGSLAVFLLSLVFYVTG